MNVELKQKEKLMLPATASNFKEKELNLIVPLKILSKKSRRVTNRRRDEIYAKNKLHKLFFENSKKGKEANKSV